MIRKIIFTAIILANTTIGFTQQTIDKVVYSKVQLREDFFQLRHYLEAKHPNLYLYSSKTTMDSVSNALYENIAPMTETQFYYYINALQPYIKDGHTYFFPSAALTDYNSKDALYLPFDVRWIDNKLYVVQNYANSNEIKIGDEIVRINDKNSADILKNMCEHQVRDGNNMSYAEWINQHYFRVYYCNYFGFTPNYKIEYKNEMSVNSAVIDGLKLDSIRAKRDRISPKLFDHNVYSSGISYEMKNNTAFLYLRTWQNKVFKEIYHQDFKKEVKSFFSQIDENKIDNLVIDLRNNQGGNYANGVYFFKYLLDKPFYYYSSFKVLNKNGKPKKTVEGRLATRKFKPHKNAFKGKVYVLTNGGSFSNSGIFSSIIQTTKRGTIIGAETGGSGIILTGGGNKTYYLPNTKIGYTNAVIEMKVLDTQNTGTGVKPDLEIKPTIQDYINNSDAVMRYILRL